MTALRKLNRSTGSGRFFRDGVLQSDDAILTRRRETENGVCTASFKSVIAYIRCNVTEGIVCFDRPADNVGHR